MGDYPATGPGIMCSGQNTWINKIRESVGDPQGCGKACGCQSDKWKANNFKKGLTEMDDFEEYRIGEYSVLSTLGEGGMGQVYHVSSCADGCEYALKVCTEQDEESKRRFGREVRAIERISHPNVMPILDTDLSSDPPFYVMPIAKCSAYDLISELSNSPEKALSVLMDACKGLQAAHLAGEYHRDIKPQNILIMEDGKVLLSDFGLVKFKDRDSTMLTKTMIALGTEMYMAPEQFLPAGSRDADERTDIFQLGKTLYHIYTGKYPAIMTSEGVPAGLWHIIQKATKQTPEDRYQSVAEIIDALNDYIAAQDPAKNPREAFAIQLDAINERLAVGQYRSNDITALITLLINVGHNHDMFWELFDKIPTRILILCAREFSHKLVDVLNIYAEIIDKAISQKNFAYAEVVAERMNAIFVATTNATLRQIALKCILCAAVDLNRFKAMNIFNKILIGIKDPSDATLIAIMLNENLGRYSKVYSQIPIGQLHPELQIQWEKAHMAIK